VLSLRIVGASDSHSWAYRNAKTLVYLRPHPAG
jgi:hypothetical protein